MYNNLNETNAVQISEIFGVAVYDNHCYNCRIHTNLSLPAKCSYLETKKKINSNEDFVE